MPFNFCRTNVGKQKSQSFDKQKTDFLFCDPDTIRTCDLLLRRQLLYPAELRGLKNYQKKKRG